MQSTSLVLLPSVHLDLYTDVTSTALTSDDLDTPQALVQTMSYLSVPFIYGRTFYICSRSGTSFHYDISTGFFNFCI